jgi:hypothetical protein
MEELEKETKYRKKKPKWKRWKIECRYDSFICKKIKNWHHHSSYVKEKDANQALEILKFTISKSSLKNLEYRLIDKENKNDFD